MAAPAEAVEPISLYIDLVPGRKADLEVIARAALAFAGAIREVAYVVDPSLELRIELVSGTESSLSLNSLLKSKIGEKFARISLSAVAFGTISWLTHKTLDYAYEKALDSVLAHEDAKSVPQEQIEAIVRKTIEAYQRQAAPRVGAIYRELGNDPAVAGVGATRGPGERPELITPRSEFAERAIASEAPYELDGERTRRERVTIEMVTLVSPVLIESLRRKWQFTGKEGPFWAPIRDGLFLDTVLHGRTAVPMVAGIRLEVDLQTIEDPAEHGAWTVRQRNILHVRRIIPPPIQGRMPLPTTPQRR